MMCNTHCTLDTYGVTLTALSKQYCALKSETEKASARKRKRKRAADAADDEPTGGALAWFLSALDEPILKWVKIR